MAEPGENSAFLHKKKNGSVFAKVNTAPENSPAPITSPRVDVSVTNGGSPWDTAARLDVLPTDSKQFDKTSKQTMHVKRVRFADAEKVVGGLPHFSEHVSDDEFVPDKQPNDDPPSLPYNLAESVKSSYSISLADLPKMHRTLNHPSRSQFSHILRQALNVDTMPEDLQNAADLVYDHCVICMKSSRPVPRPRVALPSVNKPGVCAPVDYRDIHHPSGNRRSHCPDGRSLGLARGEASASTASSIYQNCRRECEAISRSCSCVSSALCELNEDADWSVAPGDLLRSSG
jgi:hypothetical protein